MSGFTEAVMAELDAEWRSTREIAGRIPTRGVSDNSHMTNVGRVLRKAERDGLAEGRMVPAPHGRDKQWKRRSRT